MHRYQGFVIAMFLTDRTSSQALAGERQTGFLI